MTQEERDAADELTRLTEGFPEAVVCLTHGTFVPCRKKGQHQLSEEPADVDKVRYYQQMSAPPPPPAPPEHVQFTAPVDEWPLKVEERYGDSSFVCGAYTLDQLQGGTGWLTPCNTPLDDWNLGVLRESLERHIASMDHWMYKPAGRKKRK